MMKIMSKIAFLCVVSVVFTHTCARVEAGKRPNIILIMSDDMGYSDIGCYGGEIKTPNLDGLAAGGIRFTQFYNTARCCPTRASLLTGLYPHQAGVGHMMNDRGYDGYRGDLNNQCVTIAEALGDSGYRTYMSGKWHVTKQIFDDGSKHNWPRQRGFDKFYGTIHGAGSFYDPNSLTRQNDQITPLNDKLYKPDQYYYTDAISDNAVAFLQSHRVEDRRKPFFMYVAYTAAHWPMHALPQDIAKYEGKYDEGYGAIREARYKRMIEMGLIDKKWAMSPQAREWDAAKNTEWEIRNMEVYAAMVDNMDQGIGRIVDELKAQGEFENTLILFVQDNGGCAEGLGRTARNGLTSAPENPTLPKMGVEELQRSMIPPQTRDGFPTVMGPGVMPGPDGTYIAYGEGWANVSNTPFREYKHWVHEGGISTPLIAHWPKGIERTNEFETTPGHLIDIMATCVDISDTEYPKERNGESIKPMEGVSLAPLFGGDSIKREAIYWEHEGNRAIRKGDWKLVAKGANGPWELYNLQDDRTEMTDRSEAAPELAKMLADMWQAYAERANVLPLNPQPPKKVSKKKHFVLKQGESLTQNVAPNTKDFSYEMSFEIELVQCDGVIVAQGATTHGLVLYLKSGKVYFETRHSGNLSTIVSKATIEPGKYKVVLTGANDGTISVYFNGAELVNGKVPGLMKDVPVDPFDVGRDSNAPVGQYETPFEIKGRIISAEVTLK
ncbi:MAG: sulfatase-like hydrolase/transferase [Pirellulaceae bacterium]